MLSPLSGCPGTLQVVALFSRSKVGWLVTPPPGMKGFCVERSVYIFAPLGVGGNTSSLWEGFGVCCRLTSFRDIWGIQIFPGLCPDVSAACVMGAGFSKWASDVGTADLPSLNVQLSLKFSLSYQILGLTYVHCLRWGNFVGY